MFNAVRKLFTHEVDDRPERWHRQNALTPDIAELEQYQRQLVFIPDDLMRGNKNHHLIEGHTPFHPSCYTLHKYTMWKKDLGEHSIPLPFEEGIDFGVCTVYKPELARIRGELYALPSHYFWKVLDIHKQNTVQFIRKRVLISLPYREVTYDPIPNISRDFLRTKDVWMYVANPEYWEDFIGAHLGSRAVDLYEHDTPKDWIDKYYKFASK